MWIVKSTEVSKTVIFSAEEIFSLTTVTHRIQWLWYWKEGVQIGGSWVFQFCQCFGWVGQKRKSKYAVCGTVNIVGSEHGAGRELLQPSCGITRLSKIKGQHGGWEGFKNFRGGRQLSIDTCTYCGSSLGAHGRGWFSDWEAQAHLHLWLYLWGIAFWKQMRKARRVKGEKW